MAAYCSPFPPLRAAQNLFTQQELQKNKGQVWAPYLTAATRKCMEELPWVGLKAPAGAAGAAQG